MDFWRLKRADKMAHYFTNDDVKSNERKNEIIFKNKKYIMNTDNGVFSKRGLDFGTRTLLENVPFGELKGDILDFGCGYGPIGIIIKKIKDPDVTMVDINNSYTSILRKFAKKEYMKISSEKIDINNIFVNNIK